MILEYNDARGTGNTQYDNYHVVFVVRIISGMFLEHPLLRKHEAVLLQSSISLALVTLGS